MAHLEILRPFSRFLFFFLPFISLLGWWLVPCIPSRFNLSVLFCVTVPSSYVSFVNGPEGPDWERSEKEGARGLGGLNFAHNYCMHASSRFRSGIGTDQLRGRRWFKGGCSLSAVVVDLLRVYDEIVLRLCFFFFSGFSLFPCLINICL